MLDNHMPYYKKFTDIKPGALQNRAAALQEQARDQNAVELIHSVMRIGDQCAQIAREMAAGKIPFITNFDGAVPTFSPVSKRARELGGLVETNQRKK